MKQQPNLHTQLWLKIVRLEAELNEARAAAARSIKEARNASTTRAVGVELDETGYLLIHLPGSHTLRWNLGTTLSDNAMAMKALLTILRSRRADEPNMIGTQGAPTLDDLQDAIADSWATTQHIAPSHKALRPRKSHFVEATPTITLADLGL